MSNEAFWCLPTNITPVVIFAPGMLINEHSMSLYICFNRGPQSFPVVSVPAPSYESSRQARMMRDKVGRFESGGIRG
jgi:hypothetical protein